MEAKNHRWQRHSATASAPAKAAFRRLKRKEGKAKLTHITYKTAFCFQIVLCFRRFKHKYDEASCIQVCPLAYGLCRFQLLPGISLSLSCIISDNESVGCLINLITRQPTTLRMFVFLWHFSFVLCLTGSPKYCENAIFFFCNFICLLMYFRVNWWNNKGKLISNSTIWFQWILVFIFCF